MAGEVAIEGSFSGFVSRMGVGHRASLQSGLSFWDLQAMKIFQDPFLFRGANTGAAILVGSRHLGWVVECLSFLLQQDGCSPLCLYLEPLWYLPAPVPYDAHV
jgi:hypothetical protein